MTILTNVLQNQGLF